MNAMSTENAILHYIANNGQDVIVYPESISDNINIDPSINTNLPQTAINLSDILKTLGALAFKSSINDVVIDIATDEEVAEAIGDVFGKT